MLVADDAKWDSYLMSPAELFSFMPTNQKQQKKKEAEAEAKAARRVKQ